MIMTIKEALKWGEELLTSNDVEGPKPSANFLLRRVLDCDKAYLVAHDDQLLTSKEEKRFHSWVERRAKHEPVWYITGTIEFRDLVLAVNEHVLIPRPETELLVERVIRSVTSNLYLVPSYSVLDVGTGSGTIILSLVKTLSNMSSLVTNPGISSGSSEGDPPWPTPRLVSGRRIRKDDIKFFASDVSHDALKLARKNAKSNGLDKLVEFREGDLFSPWQGQKFDIIVANLPYVPHEDMATLAFDLTHYEPRLALDGGAKGMDIYERFIPELPLYLKEGGMAFLEIGYDQGPLITKIVQKVMPKASFEVLGDFANIDRIVVIKS